MGVTRAGNRTSITGANIVTTAAVLAAALLIAGCGHSRSTSTAAGSTAPAATAPRGNFEVLSFGPTSGPASTTAALTVTFSKPVDPGWILYGTTWLAAEDADTIVGGSYRTLTGTIALDATGRIATFTPDTPFRAKHEVRLLFASTLRDVTGGVLAAGTVGKGVAFTNVLENEVFEGRFMPR